MFWLASFLVHDNVLLSIVVIFMFQLSSLNKHRDDQDSKEASMFQFKNAIEAR